MKHLNAFAYPNNVTPLGWYKWYPRDFLSSSVVRRLTMTGQGVYRALLDLQWEDGSVPADYSEAILILRLSMEEAESFEHFYAQCFPNGKNPKLNALREQAILDREQQIRAGKKSAEARMKSGKAEPESNSGSMAVQPRWVNHAPQTVLLGSKSNDLPTDVQRPFNECSTPVPTDVKQAFNQTETETETETQTETYKRFIRPSQSEVEEYLVERRWKNHERKAEQFISHYESKGWKIGKAKMKSWRSAVITWEGRMNDDDFVPKPKPKTPIEGIDFQILPSGLEVTLDGRLWCIDTWRKENGL